MSRFQLKKNLFWAIKFYELLFSAGLQIWVSQQKCVISFQRLLTLISRGLRVMDFYTGWPDCANCRLFIVRLFFGSFFENYRRIQISHGKKCAVILIWIGLHFGNFFQKLIWHPAFNRSISTYQYILHWSYFYSNLDKFNPQTISPTYVHIL
jgi:hypothetical protein